MSNSRLTRRAFAALSAGAALGWPLTARAQQSGKTWRVGFLAPDRPPAKLLDAFRGSLRASGYIEGTTIEIDYRFAAGSLEELPALARALANSRVDMIVTRSTPAALAAKRATSTIPIVFVEVGDPVQSGLVKSLARPEANVTGVSSLAPDLSGKRFELLREIAPRIARVAVLFNPDNPTTVPKLRATQAAALSLKAQLSLHRVHKASELEAGFSEIRAAGADALIALLDTVVLDQRELIVASAAKLRLPAIYEIREFVEAGGLLSYGTNFVERFARAGTYVDKILKGAKPGELPVEQPVKFELVINLKTARTLGLTVPPTLLARADEVIE